MHENDAQDEQQLSQKMARDSYSPQLSRSAVKHAVEICQLLRFQSLYTSDTKMLFFYLLGRLCHKSKPGIANTPPLGRH